MPLVVWRWDAGTMLAFRSHQKATIEAVELTEIANRLQIRRTETDGESITDAAVVHHLLARASALVGWSLRRAVVAGETLRRYSGTRSCDGMPDLSVRRVSHQVRVSLQG
jgi:hypothetical protein